MKLERTFFSLVGGMAVATILGARTAAYLTEETPRLIPTLNGYLITKKEHNKSTTLFSHTTPFLLEPACDKLYLGFDDNSLKNDMLLIDNECDGIVDVISDCNGTTIRSAQTIEELLTIKTGTKKAYAMADKTLAQYKQEFADEIKRAEEANKNSKKQN